MLQIFRSSWPGILNEFVGNESFPYGHVNKTFYKPSVNIREDENMYTIELALPGFDKEDIKIHLENEMLIVSSEKSEKPELNFIRKEFTNQSFKRFFSLPDLVDQDQIAAEFKNGILQLNIQKKETSIKQTREIAVN